MNKNLGASGSNLIPNLKRESNNLKQEIDNTNQHFVDIGEIKNEQIEDFDENNLIEEEDPFNKSYITAIYQLLHHLRFILQYK